MSAERNQKVALLGRDGPARERLREALNGLGVDIVLEVDPVEADSERIRRAGPQALLVILEPAIEDALDMLGPVLEEPTLTVLFEEADLILRRNGWDAQRWTRHLASKLHIDADVLPARQADSPEPADAPMDAARPSRKRPAPEAKAKTTTRTPVNASKAKKPADEKAAVATIPKPAKPIQAAGSEQATAGTVGATRAAVDATANGSAYAPMSKASAAQQTSTSAPTERKAHLSPARGTEPPPVFEPDKGAEIYEFMEMGEDVRSAPVSGEPHPFDPVLSEIELGPEQTSAPFDFQSSSLDDEPTRADSDGVFEAAESSTADADFVLSWQNPDDAIDVVTEVDPLQEFPPPDMDRVPVSGKRTDVPSKTKPADVEERSSVKTTVTGLSLEEFSDEPANEPAKSGKREETPVSVDEINFGNLELTPLDSESSFPDRTEEPAAPAGATLNIDSPMPEASPEPASKPVDESGNATMRLVDLEPSSVGLTAEDAAEAGVVLVLAGIGGPDAVRKLLADLPAGFPHPLLVQLRLDGGRYDNLVRQISRVSNQPVLLAEAEQMLEPGNVYVLPDHISIEPVSGGMRFVHADSPEEIISVLPPAGSAVLFLSGSDPARVDAAFAFAESGGWLAGQSLEGCYDATAVKLLAAHGVGLSAPSGLVAEMIERLG